MKSIFKVSLLAATVAFVAGCQQDEEKAPETPAVEQVASSNTAAEPSTTTESNTATKSVETEFKTADEKAAYAIGSSFATYLNASIEKPAELGINLDKTLLLKGIEDVFDGKGQLTEEEARAALEDLDKRVSDIMQKKATEKAAANKSAGDEYRAKFAKEEGVTTTESGLMYKVLKKGDGEKPKATDTVQVHYKGTLIDGTKFDSSYDRKEPATFPLDRVISGWTEGVQLMSVGSKYEFVIPPQLAYGEQDTPTIPANSTLVFEVELLKVEKPAKQAEQKAESKASQTK